MSRDDFDLDVRIGGPLVSALHGITPSNPLAEWKPPSDPTSLGIGPTSQPTRVVHASRPGDPTSSTLRAGHTADELTAGI